MRREFDLHELAVEDAIKAHQRPKLEIYGDIALRRPEDGPLGERRRRARRDPPLRRRRLHRLGSPRRDRASTTSACGWRSGPICFAAVRARRSTPSSTRSSTTTSRSSSTSTRRSRRSRRRSSPAARTNPAERIYTLKRDVLELHGAVVPLVGPVQRARERAAPPRERGDPAVLPRRARPPATRGRRRCRSSASC